MFTTMNRITEENLADFGAAQERHFDPAAWLTQPHPTGANPEELATVALFLAETTRLAGLTLAPENQLAQNSAQLTRVGQQLAKGKTFAQLRAATAFEPARFAGMLDEAARSHPAHHA